MEGEHTPCRHRWELPWQSLRPLGSCTPSCVPIPTPVLCRDEGLGDSLPSLPQGTALLTLFT